MHLLNLEKNGLFLVEKNAQINPADLNPGETFATKYFCKKCQAGRGKASSVCMHLAGRCQEHWGEEQPQRILP